VAMFVAVAAACGALFVGATAAADHEDMADAREPQPPQFESLATWAAANTRPIDVLLSTNELSFAWAALTGRKTLVSRRAQNDAFLDLDQRNADATTRSGASASPTGRCAGSCGRPTGPTASSSSAGA